jgi:hypothetical protein
MDRLIYVGPNLIVKHTGLGHGGGWHEIEMKYLLYTVAAKVSFIEKNNGSTIMTCSIGGPVGSPIDLVDFHNVLSFFMQNYQALSDVMVGAYKNGFLETEF